MKLFKPIKLPLGMTKTNSINQIMSINNSILNLNPFKNKMRQYDIIK
jgi:hypothetical protein